MNKEDIIEVNLSSVKNIVENKLMDSWESDELLDEFETILGKINWFDSDSMLEATYKLLQLYEVL